MYVMDSFPSSSAIAYDSAGLPMLLFPRQAWMALLHHLWQALVLPLTPLVPVLLYATRLTTTPHTAITTPHTTTTT